MKKILIFFLALILPSVSGEIDHTPDEVNEGNTLTAWIDADDDVKSIAFYVCNLKSGICYKPQTLTKEETENNRFQFEYIVQEDDYPGYKYELEKEDNSTEKVPASEYSHYEGMEVEKMGDTYYFKVDVKANESSEESRLPGLSILAAITLFSILASRRK